MTDYKKELDEMLAAGKRPTYNDLVDALAGALKERNMFQSMTQDMAKWLSQLVTAHLGGNYVDVQNTLDSFIKAKVKMVNKPSPGMH